MDENPYDPPPIPADQSGRRYWPTNDVVATVFYWLVVFVVISGDLWILDRILASQVTRVCRRPAAASAPLIGHSCLVIRHSFDI